MAAQGMQVSQIAAGSPILRRTSVILAVAAALAIGALIGRETATTSKAGHRDQAGGADRTDGMGHGRRR